MIRLSAPPWGQGRGTASKRRARRMAQRERAGERRMACGRSSAAVATAGLDSDVGATAAGARAVTAGRSGELGASTP